MRHPLPYTFAKAHHVLLQDDGHQRVLWTGPETSTSALSEVLRLHTVDMLQRESSRDLDTRIAAAYAGGESSAAAVVGEVENAVDLSRLMQDSTAKTMHRSSVSSMRCSRRPSRTTPRTSTSNRSKIGS